MNLCEGWITDVGTRALGRLVSSSIHGQRGESQNVTSDIVHTVYRLSMMSSRKYALSTTASRSRGWFVVCTYSSHLTDHTLAQIDDCDSTDTSYAITCVIVDTRNRLCVCTAPGQTFPLVDSLGQWQSVYGWGAVNSAEVKVSLF